MPKIDRRPTIKELRKAFRGLDPNTRVEISVDVSTNEKDDPGTYLTERAFGNELLGTQLGGAPSGGYALTIMFNGGLNYPVKWLRTKADQDADKAARKAARKLQLKEKKL